MPPKAQKEIIQAINSPEHFLELISPENKKLAGIPIPLCLIISCSDRYPSDMVRPLRGDEPELQDYLVQL